MKKSWKIGTRGSLLALTQCTQTKNQLEATTGEKFELVIIKTRGDQQTDVPLWQLEGKDFFTRELDTALLAGEVDLVVHSYKDLGSERPQGIKLAAITKRNFGHDILLIPNKVVTKLVNEGLESITIGTSSPRRIVNLENAMPLMLPSNPVVKTKMLRGNVNTRVKKLVDGEYDAIVLAMPGLERLAMDQAASLELAPLLKDMNFAILPPSKFPWAASQGALAIEMNQDHPQATKLQEVLSSVHDNETQEDVKRERAAFNSYGGGCHLAVGVSVIGSKNIFVHSHKGERDNENIEKLFLEPEVEKVKSNTVFIGMPSNDKLVLKKAIPNLKFDCSGKDVFATSSHVISCMQNPSKAKGVWAAGTKTWEKLARENIWVNGAADSLGEEQLKSFSSSALLKLLRGGDFNWQVLSGSEAHSTLGPVTETYTREVKNIDDAFKSSIEAVSDFFWTSFNQYQAYLTQIPSIADKRHWCGVGKTYDAFVASHIPVIAVSGINEFKNLTDSK